MHENKAVGASRQTDILNKAVGPEAHRQTDRQTDRQNKAVGASGCMRIKLSEPGAHRQTDRHTK